MKQLIVILFFIILLGCKEKQVVPAPFVPSVDQRVWHADDGYHLETYIMTEPEYFYNGHTVTYTDYNTPYDHKISGNFKYIRDHKQEEYDIAHQYLLAEVDSVKILRDIPNMERNVCLNYPVDTLVIIQTYDTLKKPKDNSSVFLSVGYEIGPVHLFMYGKTRDTIHRKTIIYK